jgi:hypothetical protein
VYTRCWCWVVAANSRSSFHQRRRGKYFCGRSSRWGGPGYVCGNLMDARLESIHRMNIPTHNIVNYFGIRNDPKTHLEHWFQDVVVPIMLESYHRSEPQQQQLLGCFPTENVTATKDEQPPRYRSGCKRQAGTSNDGPSRIHSQRGSLKKAVT